MSTEMGLPLADALKGTERGVTKYEKLRRGIAAAIDEGRLPAGSKMPNELALVAQTGFSLGTVQRALRELAAQGYVERRHGTGTFVIDRRRRMEEPLHCRFLDPDDAQPLPVYTHLLGRSLIDEDGPWNDALGHGTDRILRLDRRIDIDGRFAVGSRFYVRAARFERLLSLPVQRLDGRNIKKVLHEEFGLAVVRISQKMRLAPVEPEVAHWMGLAGGELVMTIRAVGYAADDTPIYYQALSVPPTEEELSLDVIVDA